MRDVGEGRRGEGNVIGRYCPLKSAVVPSRQGPLGQCLHTRRLLVSLHYQSHSGTTQRAHVR